MTQQPEPRELARQRSRLHAHPARVADFRPGSLSAVRRRSGKPTRACAAPAEPGHGPQHILTRKVAGRTVALHLEPGPGLEKVAREVARRKRPKAIMGQIVEVDEAIRAARPVPALAEDASPPRGTEQGSASQTSRRSSRRS